MAEDLNLGVRFSASGTAEFKSIIRTLRLTIEGLAQSEAKLNAVLDQSKNKAYQTSASFEQLTRWQEALGKISHDTRGKTEAFRAALDHVINRSYKSATSLKVMYSALQKAEQDIIRENIALGKNAVEARKAATTSELLARAQKIMEAQVKRTTRAQKEQTNVAHRHLSAMDRLKNAMRIVAEYGGAARVLQLVTGAFSAGISEIHAYDQALHNLQAITGATTEEVGRMATVIKDVAGITKFSTKEVAEGMVLLGQAGFSATESIDAMQHIADLATGTLTSMEYAVDLVTTAIRAFQLETNETQRVVDVFANAVNKSKLTVDKLRIAMNYVGPIAEKAGLEIEDAAAAMMQLANSGVRASTIGTGLRQMLARLLSPTKKMLDVFEATGANLERLNPLTSDFRDVVDELSVTITNAKQAFQAFGLRAAPAVLAIVKEGVQGFDLMRAYTERAGSASQMATLQQEGLGIALKNTKDKLGLVAIALGENGLIGAFKIFYDVVRAVIDAFTELLRNPLGAALTTFALLTTTIFGTKAAFTLLWSELAKVWLVGRLIAAVNLLTASIRVQVALLGVWRVAMNLMWTAISRLWMLLAAHPLVAITIGVVAAVSAWKAYTTATEKTSETTRRQIEIFKNQIKFIDSQIKGINALNKIIHNSLTTDHEKQIALKNLYTEIGKSSEYIDEATGELKDYEKALRDSSSAAEEFIKGKAVEATKKNLEAFTLLRTRITQLQEEYKTLEISFIASNKKMQESADSIFAPLIRNYIDKTAKQLEEKTKTLADAQREYLDMADKYIDMSRAQYAAELRNLNLTEEQIKKRAEFWTGMDRPKFEELLDMIGLETEARENALAAWDSQVARREIIQNRELQAHKQLYVGKLAEDKAYLETSGKIFEEAGTDQTTVFRDNLTNYARAHRSMINTIIGDYRGFVTAIGASLDEGEDLFKKYGKRVSEENKEAYNKIKFYLEEYVKQIKDKLDDAKESWADYADQVRSVNTEIFDVLREAQDEERERKRSLLSDAKKYNESIMQAAKEQILLNKAAGDYAAAVKRYTEEKNKGENADKGTLKNLENEIKAQEKLVALYKGRVQSAKDELSVVEKFSDQKKVNRDQALIDRQMFNTLSQYLAVKKELAQFEETASRDNVTRLVAEEKAMTDLLNKVNSTEAKINIDFDDVINAREATKQAAEEFDKLLKEVEQVTGKMSAAFKNVSKDVVDVGKVRVQLKVDEEAFRNSLNEEFSKINTGQTNDLSRSVQILGKFDKNQIMQDLTSALEPVQERINKKDFNALIKWYGEYNPTLPLGEAVQGIIDLIQSIPSEVGDLAVTVNLTALTEAVDKTSQLINDISVSLNSVSSSTVSWYDALGKVGVVIAGAFTYVVKIRDSLIESVYKTKEIKDILEAMSSMKITPDFQPQPDLTLVNKAIKKLKETIYTKVVYTSEDRTSAPKGHRLGGLIRKMMGGGFLPGYGGGDRVPILAEDGEYMVRKEAVRTYGKSVLDAINSMTFNPHRAVPKFKEGGMIPGKHESMTVRFQSDGTEYPVEIKGSDNIDVFREFTKTLNKLNLTSSKR